MMIKVNADVPDGEYAEKFAFACRVKIENGVATPIFDAFDYTIHIATRNGVSALFATCAQPEKAK